MHVRRISIEGRIPARADSIQAPNYPPGLLGLLLQIRDAMKGIVY